MFGSASIEGSTNADLNNQRIINVADPKNL